MMILSCPLNDANGKCPCDKGSLQVPEKCGLGTNSSAKPVEMRGCYCPSHGFYPRLTCPVCMAEMVEVTV